MLFLGHALGEGSYVAGVGYVGVDVDLGVCVEGELCGAVDTPAWVCDEQDGVRGNPC